MKPQALLSVVALFAVDQALAANGPSAGNVDPTLLTIASEKPAKAIGGTTINELSRSMKMQDLRRTDFIYVAQPSDGNGTGPGNPEDPP